MVDRVAFSLFGVEVYWYGIIITLGCVLGVWLAVYRAKKAGWNPDFVYDFLFLALPLAIICARLYYVAFEWPYYAANPMKIFAIRDGGIAIYGGVIGGVLAVYLFARYYKKPKPSFGQMCDLFAPSLILGQAIGRWGNFVNQEAYSYITAPHWMRFPLAVYIEAIGEWRLATFFYESAWNFLVFGALLWYARVKRPSGCVFALYLLLYSFGRMFIEGLRSDSLWLIPGAIRVSQLLAALLCVGAAGYLYWVNRKQAKLER